MKRFISCVAWVVIVAIGFGTASAGSEIVFAEDGSREETVESHEYFVTEEDGDDEHTTKRAVESPWTETEFCIDFEGFDRTAESVNLDKVTGNAILSTIIDEEHGQSARISTSSSAKFMRTFAEPIKNGTWLFEFDYYCTNTTSETYIRLFNSDYTAYNSANDDRMYNVFGRSGANMGTYLGLKNRTLTRFSKAVTPKQWYDVSVWLDFGVRKIYIYINNEYVDAMNMPDNLKNIAGFWCVGVDSDSTTWNVYDNFTLKEMKSDDITAFEQNGILIPESVVAPLSFRLFSKELGNIFYSKDDVSLTAEIGNKLEEDFNGKIDYTVTNSIGEIVWKKAEKINLQPGQNIQRELKPSVNRFDIYDLKMVVTAEDGSRHEFERQFSIANTMKGMDKNDKFGMCIHISWMTRTGAYEGLNLMHKMGMGIIREAFVFTDIENKPAVKQRMDDIIKYAQEYDIDIMVTAKGFTFPCTTNLDGTFTVNEAAYKELYEKAKKFAAEYKGKIDIWETLNEVNRERVNAYSFEAYVKYLEAFYTGIKAGNPDAIVVGCNTSRADDGWIEGVIRAGGGKYMDAVSVHAYQGSTTPETANWAPYVMTVKNMLKDYGCEHIEVWVDEANTSASPDWNTELQHAQNLIRQYALTEAFKPVDKFISYQFQTNDYDENYMESRFGVVRGWDVDNKYGAKPAFLAVSNYSAMTEDTEYKEHLRKDAAYLYRYEKTDGSQNVIMMYSDQTVTPVSLKIGTETGTLYDMYGNSKKLYSDDGIFTFSLNDSPCYFVSDGKEFEVVDTRIEFDQTVLELPIESIGSINAKISDGYDVKISARDSINAKLVKKNGGFSISVKPEKLPEKVDYQGYIHLNGTDRFWDYINIELSKNGKLYAYLPVAVSYLKKDLDVEITFEPYNNKTKNHFVGVVKVENISQKNVSGYVILDSPTKIAEEFGKVRVENLKPGESKKIRFNIPSDTSRTATQYSGRFVRDGNGNEYEFNMGAIARSNYYTSAGKVKLQSICKAQNPITVDGKVTETEWGKGFFATVGAKDITISDEPIIVDGQTQVDTTVLGKGEVKSDLEGSVYALWDEEYLYVAAVVNDDVHHNQEWNYKLYISDCLSVVVVPTSVQRHNARFDFALSEFYDKPWALINWSPVWKSKYCGNLEQGENGAQYEITRNGLQTVYEMRISWKDLIYGGVEEYDNFSLSIILKDYDVTREKSVTFGGWTCLVD